MGMSRVTRTRLAPCDDLRYRCGRFAKAFQCEIGSITPALVQKFLNDLKLSARSVNNFRKTIKTLFEFAKARKYLPRDVDLLAFIYTAFIYLIHNRNVVI